MKRIASLGFGKLAILATLASVLIILVAFGQDMFSSGPLSEQNPRKVPRGGVGSHAEITSCSACHAPAWSSETMATRCMNCHDNVRDQLDGAKPMHGMLAAGEDCMSCHTEHKGPHALLTNMTKFDHACAAFKLTGKHRQVDCKSCHTGDAFQGTPQACIACHAQDEAKAHKGKFAHDCQQCHSSPDTWKSVSLKKEVFTSAKFDHGSVTGFPLTGKHASADCKACHVDESAKFKGLQTSCVSCHAADEAKSHKGKFVSADCQRCHATNDWKPMAFNKESFISVGFNHDRDTAFKLTGKHMTADCKSCHTNNTYKGTPQSCVSCHAEPPSHKPHPKSFGTNCVQCHTTLSWQGATLTKHTFPMNHRTKNGKNSACIVCHKDTMQTFVSFPPTIASPSYVTYTCYGCHAHTPEREVRRHLNRRNVTAQNLNKCASCHKNGRNGRERATLEERVGLELCQACPEAMDGLSDSGCPTSDRAEPCAPFSPVGRIFNPSFPAKDGLKIRPTENTDLLERTPGPTNLVGFLQFNRNSSPFGFQRKDLP